MLTRAQKHKSQQNLNVDSTDLDITDIVNFAFPAEKHILGMNYCGPGTDLKKRLMSDGVTPKPEYAPVDRVDESALKHDIAYSRFSDLRRRHEADKIMISEMLSIERPTCKERLERCICVPILYIKRCIDGLILRLFYSRNNNDVIVSM